MSDSCIFCKEVATVGVRGMIAKDYVNTCPFHAGMLQAIFERLEVINYIKWRPIILQNKEKV